MIPRVVHQFWAGGPCPWDLSSWDLDGWEHHVWSPANLPAWFTPTPQWENPEAYAIQYHHPTERLWANILRYELLGELGGVWVDCDMELVGDLDQLLVGSCSLARFGIQIGTAFIAAVPHHPFVESCRAALRALDRPVAVSSMWAAAQAPTDEVTFLDPALVYPWPYWAHDEAVVEPTVLRNLPRVA